MNGVDDYWVPGGPAVSLSGTKITSRYYSALEKGRHMSPLLMDDSVQEKIRLSLSSLFQADKGEIVPWSKRGMTLAADFRSRSR